MCVQQHSVMYIQYTSLVELCAQLSAVGGGLLGCGLWAHIPEVPAL
jgi:hypothetical protein